MQNSSSRDDFEKKIIDTVARRASYICSNPECRSLTLCASESDENKYIYIGQVAHVSAASRGGPRYDETMTTEQRKSIDNAIFLCSSCATMIDKNNGADFNINLLKKWKNMHEGWIAENLNKSVTSPIAVISGTHEAKGRGKVTGIKARGPVLFKPGTRALAEGEGSITGLDISN